MLWQYCVYLTWVSGLLAWPAPLPTPLQSHPNRGTKTTFSVIICEWVQRKPTFHDTTGQPELKVTQIKCAVWAGQWNISVFLSPVVFLLEMLVFCDNILLTFGVNVHVDGPFYLSKTKSYKFTTTAQFTHLFPKRERPLLSSSSISQITLTTHTVILESAEPVTILSSFWLPWRPQTLSWWASSVFTHSLVFMVHSFTKPSEPLRTKCRELVNFY